MLEEVHCEDGLRAERSPALAALGVSHLFPTRRGPGGAELDLGALSPQQRLALLEDAGLPPDIPLVLPRQVHGDRVFVVEDELTPSEPADALVTERPEVALAVLAADCVPILVARADGGRVAAIHAGWRGLVRGVIPRALERLGAGEHVAAVGPCLSAERCEVGPEVAERFIEADLEGALLVRPRGKPLLDLRAAAAIQLERGDVARIEVSERCTWDDPDLWSHRRDVTHGGAVRTGRQGALVAVRG